MRRSTHIFCFICISAATLFSATVAQALTELPGNAKKQGCSLFNIGCQIGTIIEGASHIEAIAHEIIDDAANSANDPSSVWENDAAEEALDWAIGAADSLVEGAGGLVIAAASTARDPSDNADTFLLKALEYAGGASSDAEAYVYNSGINLLRSAYENGNDFRRGIYLGGNDFISELVVDPAVAIAMEYQPGVDPASSWLIASSIENTLNGQYGYDVGSDPVLDAAMNYAIDRVLTMPPHLVRSAAPDILQELIEEFGYETGRHPFIQLALERSTDIVDDGEISRYTSGCSLAPKLRVADLAVLGTELPNRIRYAPTVDASQVGKIHPFERVYIAGGPICNEGYFWYFVIADEANGWTVQGSDGRYWLDPVSISSISDDDYQSATSSSETTPDEACPMAPRLIAGGSARNVSSSANRVRANPSLSADQIGRIAADEIVYIEEGPVCADGYNWYKVRNQHLYGWTAEAGNGEYWIVTIR